MAFAYLLSCVLIASIISCTDDDVFELEDKTVTFSEFEVNYEKGGALVAVSDIVGGFYNFAEGGDASVGFTVDDFGGDATSVDIYKSLNGGSPVLHSTVSSLPANINISLAEAMNGLGNLSDVKLLDQIVYTFEISTAEGTFPSGASVTANVSCSSNLAGEYTSTTTGMSTDGCCPGSVTVEKDITLTDLGGGKYTINDWSGGLYLEWYAVYGITADTDMTATLEDVCDVVSGSLTEPFGTAASLSGAVDLTTGIITFSFLTGYDDVGTIVMTPK